MPFFAVRRRRTNQAVLYSQFLCNFVVRRFQPLRGILYPYGQKRRTAQILGLWCDSVILYNFSLLPLSILYHKQLFAVKDKGVILKSE